ncbi:MAG: hypothetical protein KC994_21495, partial [Candidatus Omnitrophica bacterium]|nr:hypothetical protein [Candidatus Omnitrophota bacterium]
MRRKGFGRRIFQSTVSLSMALFSVGGAVSETVTLPGLGWEAQKVESATFDLTIEDETLEVAVEPFYVKPTLVTRKEFNEFLTANPEASEP